MKTDLQVNLKKHMVLTHKNGLNDNAINIDLFFAFFI